MQWLHISLFILGLSLLILFLKKLVQVLRLVKNGIKTTAEVVRIDSYKDEGQKMYTPVFEYQDRNNVKQLYISPISSSRSTYKVGDSIQVIYNPHNSKEVRTISFWNLYGYIGLMGIMGLLLLILEVNYLFL